MKRYTRRPITVSAVQLTRKYKKERRWPKGINQSREGYVYVEDTLEKVFENDWIVKHTSGRIEIFPDEVFRSEFEGS